MKTKLFLMAAVLFSCGISFAKPVVELQDSVAMIEVVPVHAMAHHHVIVNPVPLVVAQPQANQPLWMKGWRLLEGNNVAVSIGTFAGYFLLTQDKAMPIRERIFKAFFYVGINLAAMRMLL